MVEGRVLATIPYPIFCSEQKIIMRIVNCRSKRTVIVVRLIKFLKLSYRTCAQ